MTLEIPISMVNIIREQCPSVDIEIKSNKKIQFEQFEKLTDEMLEYCDQDVNLTYRIFSFLIKQANFPAANVIHLENRVANIIRNQTDNGFYFDIDKAKSLYTNMRFEKLSKDRNLQKIFSPMYLPEGPIKTTAKLIKRRQYLPSTTQLQGW